MTVQEDFYRYNLKASFGVICSPTCNILYANTDKQAIVGALYEIKIWNLRTGVLEKTLVDENETGKSQLTILALNPSNKDILAAGYEDGSIRLWNISEAKILVQFNGHRTAVTALSFDPYTKRMASGGRDSDIVIWDLVAETGLFRLQGHTGGISAVQFIRSGQFLISAARDSLLKLWDLETQSAIETEVSHRTEISDIVTSSDEQILLTVGADQLLRVFHVDHEALLGIISSSSSLNSGVRALNLLGEVQRGSKERALQMALHSNHRYLTILSSDSSLEFFELRGKEEAKAKLRRKKKKNEGEDVELAASDLFKPIRSYRLSSKAHSFALDKDAGKEHVKVIVGYNNNRLEELQVPLDAKLEVINRSTVELMGHRSDIKSVAISSNQRSLISGGPDGVKVWNLEDGAYIRGINSEEATGISAIAFLADTAYVILGTKKGLLIIANSETGEAIEAYKAHDGAIWSLDVGSDGRTIATASSDKTVKIWEFKESKLKLKCIKTLDLGDEALVVKLSRDLRLIAVATLDMTVKVFFLDSLKIFLTLYGHKLPVSSIDISNDCKTLITGSLDKSIKIWGLEFGELRKSLLAHSEAVTQVKFIPNHSAFVSVGKDKVIKTWSASGAFAPLQSYFECPHFGEIWGLAVSPSFIVTSGHDKCIKVYSLSDELLVPIEEAEREAERRLELSVIDSGEGNQSEPSKLTIESMKSGERILMAIEAADEERSSIDESIANGSVHTQTIVFKTIAKGLQPYEYVMKQFDSIPTPDLDQSIILLPSRSLYSLLYYIDKAIDSPYIAVSAAVFHTCMRIFFNEITADKQLRDILVSIKSKLRKNLTALDELYMFNYVALKAIQRE